MAMVAPAMNPEIQALMKQQRRNKWDKIIKSFVKDYLLNAQNAGGFSATSVPQGTTVAQNISELMKKPRKVGVTVTIKMAKEMGPGKNIVTILCDRSDRYNSKLFNKEFLNSKNLPIPNWI